MTRSSGRIIAAIRRPLTWDPVQFAGAFFVVGAAALLLSLYLEVGFLRSEYTSLLDEFEKDVGYLHAPNWGINYLLILPLLAYYVGLTFASASELRRRFRAKGMLIEPKTSEPVGDSTFRAVTRKWLLTRRASARWFVLVAILLLFPNYGEFAEYSLSPLLRGAAIPEVDWSVAALDRPDIIGRGANVAFSFLVFTLQYVSSVLVVWFLGHVVAVSRFVRSLARERDAQKRAFLLVPDGQSSDRRKGFEVLSDFALNALLVLLLCFCALVLSRLWNVYLRSDSPTFLAFAQRDLMFDLGVWRSFGDDREAWGRIIDPEAARKYLDLDYSKVVVSLAGIVVVAAVVFVALFNLRFAAVRARENGKRWAASSAGLEAMRVWPLEWPSANLLILLCGAATVGLLVYQMLFAVLLVMVGGVLAFWLFPRVRELKPMRVIGVAGVLLAVMTLVVRIVLRSARSDSAQTVRSHLIEGRDSREESRARKLAVVVHGLSRGSASMHGPVKSLQARGDTDVLVFGYNSGPLSVVDPYAVVGTIRHDIEHHFGEGAYDVVTLVGHDAGALLLRKAYVAAREDDGDAGSWAHAVDRFIFFEGLNRGWRIALPLYGLSRLFDAGDLMVGIQKGSPFVADLQLQWLRLGREAKRGPGGAGRGVDGSPLPVVVNLRSATAQAEDRNGGEGSADSLDLLNTNCLVTQKLSLNTNRDNIVQFDDGADGEARRRSFEKWLALSTEELRARTRKPKPEGEGLGVKRVVFMLHGIRDIGTWTRRLAPAYESDECKVITSSYGRFPIASFLLPWRRQEEVRWLMSRYTAAVARYPNCESFDFIAHSNGTHLITSALESYDEFTARRLVFVGSVVPKGFRWSRHKRDSPTIDEDLGSYESLRNYVSATDVVVAVFPGFHESLARVLRFMTPSLGSGGFNGFDEGTDHEQMVRFVDEGHGGVLSEPGYLADIKRFIDDGALPADPTPLDEAPWWAELLYEWNWVVWSLIAAVLFEVIRRVSRAVGRRTACPRAVAALGLILTLYVFISNV